VKLREFDVLAGTDIASTATATTSACDANITGRVCCWDTARLAPARHTLRVSCNRDAPERGAEIARQLDLELLVGVTATVKTEAFEHVIARRNVNRAKRNVPVVVGVDVSVLSVKSGKPLRFPHAIKRQQKLKAKPAKARPKPGANLGCTKPTT
jgi:hypothetical protein